MASPFSVFRSNLKPLMVALTLLSLFAFVALPALQMYQQYNVTGGSPNPQIATYDGGSFDEAEIAYFNRTHGQTARFLTAVAEQVIARGGTPRVPGFQVDPRTGQIVSLGISPMHSPRTAVLTQLYAERASELGLELDDAAIDQWMALFTDGKLSQNELAGIRAEASQNFLGESQLYNHLRTELLATLFQRLAASGLSVGQSLIVPPTEAWLQFLKLNQEAVVTAYPVLVEEFLDQTSEPSQAEVEAIYAKGKDRFPNPDSPEPAFRRRYTANVEFVSAALDDFVQQEIAKLSEEEIRAEYEERASGGDFQLPPIQEPATDEPATDEPATDEPATDEPATDEPATDEPATDEPATDEPATDEPATDEPATDEPATEEPATEEPATEEPATEEPATEEPATEEPATEEPATDEPATDEPATDEPATDEPATEEPVAEEPATEEPATEEPADPADENDATQSRRAVESVFRFAALRMQDEETATDADSAAEQEPVEEAQPEEADSQPVPSADSAPGTDAESDAPADETPADETPADETPADETPADETPADETPADETPAEEPPADAAPADAAPATRPFEEVRDQIARSMVIDDAASALDSAINEANSAMRDYFTKMAVYEDLLKTDPTAAEPERPNLQQLAERLGLRYGQTGMQDALTIRDTPIGQSRGLGEVMFRRGEPFAVLMYTDEKPLLTPLQTVNDAEQLTFVSWKTEARDAYIPELTEVRDEVAAAARLIEARELAKQEAEEFAAKANATADKSIEAVVPETRKNLVFKDIGPFPWLRYLGPGTRPFIAGVPELNNVGEEFMRTVFRGPLNEYGVGPNAPKTVYYVVKTTDLQPSTEELRTRFMQENQRRAITDVAFADASQIYNGWAEAFEENIGLEWNDEALLQQQ